MDTLVLFFNLQKVSIESQFENSILLDFPVVQSVICV
jgi:hypothetical protein